MALNAALGEPSIRAAITERGDEPGGGTPQALAQLTAEQFHLWGPIVKANDIRAD